MIVNAAASSARILIVEDDFGMRLVVKRLLEHYREQYVPVFAASVAEASEYLRHSRFDVVLCDVHLEDGTGFDLMAAFPNELYVLMSGARDHASAAQAVRSGAFDYFLKGGEEAFTAFLPLTLDRAVRKRHLERSERMLTAAVTGASDAIYVTDSGGNILFANAQCELLYGHVPATLVGRNELVLWDDTCQQRLDIAGPREVVHRHASGEPIPVSITRSIVPEPNGLGDAMLNIVRDVRAQKAVEAQIQHMMARQARTNEDFLAALQKVHVGIVIVEADGNATFTNSAISALYPPGQEPVFPCEWRKLFPLQASALATLEAAMRGERAPDTLWAITVDWPCGRRSWLELEAHPHPMDASRRILFIYDRSEVHGLRERLDERAQFENMIGVSAPMERVFEIVRRAGPLDVTVLIRGETGTGKELVARAIHAQSERKGRPFLPVNCATFTEALLASQLFGHRKGAFTGAINEQKGIFEAAAGGTVFLDEIGEMPLTLQSALLRVLEQREITPVGDAEPRKIDVRVIAATNRDLESDIAQNRFRQDLYYRLRVARVALPPLRERREDIPLVAMYALQAAAAKMGRSVRAMDTEVLEHLMQYPWPGNVRELVNTIDYAVMLCQDHTLRAEHLPPELCAVSAPPPLTLRAPLQATPAVSHADVLSALQRSRGNRSLAAKILGISRATLYRRLQTPEE